jgi:carbon storage regulator
MLVLSRKPGEKIVIGNGITITVVETLGNRVRLGIEAPPQIHILRGELAEWITPPASKTEGPDPEIRSKPDWSAEVVPHLVVTHR